MSKTGKVIVLSALLVLLIPLAANAFSFSGFWNKIFNKSAERSAEEEFQYEKLNKELAKDKRKAWKQAYEDKDIHSLISEEHNLLFSNAEINYIFRKELENIDDPPVGDFEIWFKEGGYIYTEARLLKYLPGKVSGEIDFIEEANDQIVPRVRKIKWRGFPFPAFIANTIFKDKTQPIRSFIKGDSEFELSGVRIEEDFCQLKIERKD